MQVPVQHAPCQSINAPMAAPTIATHDNTKNHISTGTSLLSSMMRVKTKLPAAHMHDARMMLFRVARGFRLSSNPMSSPPSLALAFSRDFIEVHFRSFFLRNSSSIHFAFFFVSGGGHSPR